MILCPHCYGAIEQRRNGAQRCECACHPDLAWVDWGDALNPLFSVSDVDALFVAERYGQFLFIEWKKPGEEIPRGQRQLLTMLARLPKVTVLVVQGARGHPAVLRVVHPSAPWRAEDLIQIDRIAFERRLQRWYAGANQQQLERWRARDGGP